MTDIAEEIQAERAQILAQERELNIKKIQLAIKELYAAFEDGQIVYTDDVALEEIVGKLNSAVGLSQRRSKGFSQVFPDGSSVYIPPTQRQPTYLDKAIIGGLLVDSAIEEGRNPYVEGTRQVLI
jgi:hypothetical protein